MKDGQPAGVPPAVLSAALFAVIFWGGSPVGTKIAVASFSPLAMSALRSFIAAPLAILLALVLKVKLPRSPYVAALMVLCGCCGFVGFPVIFTLGMARTSGIHGAMIMAMLPVFTGAFAHVVERRRPALRWWAGCLLALAGEALLVSGRAPAGEASVAGDALVTASALVASVGYVTGARLSQQGYPSQGTTYWGLTAAALIFAPFAPWLLGGIDWPAIPAPAWTGVVYLALGVSLLGYVIWYWALGKGGIARLSTLQFLQPVAGVVLAWLILGEPVTIMVLAASIIILAGVFIATRAPER